MIDRMINTLCRKIRRFTVPNLMNYIIGGTVAAYLLSFVFPRLSSGLFLYRSALLKGEVWRLVTFIFLPTSSSPIWLAISLYFYWLIGRALEHEWGTARFTVYYLFGMAGSWLAALLTGFASNTYLNMSLFLAFAALWPDYQVMLFFILPIKMKWLAVADLALYAVSFLFGSWSTRVTILFSLLNVILFFGTGYLNRLRNESSYWKTRRNFRKTMYH